MRATERQIAPHLEDIHLGHRMRYLFARDTVTGNVLDAGCGVGYGAKMMHDAGAHVTAIDLEPEAIDYAIEHYPGPHYQVGDVTESREHPFDWVVCFEVIEHLQDPVAALTAFRSAKRLIVSTPNENKFPFNPESYRLDEFPHLRHYTPQELDLLLSDCGWEVQKRYTQLGKRSMVTPGTDGMFLVYVCR